ncbi:carboxy terminal-processing peptidase [Aurantivibrio plasticivorans]
MKLSRSNLTTLKLAGWSFSVLSLMLCYVSTSVALTQLTPLREQGKTAQELVSTLNSRHFRKMPLNDTMSERFFDNYIDTLDPAKSFFYESDIKEFESHSTKFDDYIRAGDLSVGYDIFNRYRQRVAVRLESAISRLENPDQTFEFTTEDSINVDFENSVWSKDLAESNKLWHKRIKLNLLSLMLTDKTLEEAKTALIKRYQMQLTRVEQQNQDDVFETMMNALTLLYDPHTNYMSPSTVENFTINMSLQLQGIGAVLRTEDEYTKVDRVIVGGPADKQGELKRSDRIVAVGQGDQGELVDVIDWRLDDVVQLIRGQRNTIVRLKTLTPEDQIKIVKITRDTVKLEEQAAKKAVFELTDGKNLYKVGVIDIPTFYHDFEAYRRRDPNARSTTRDVQRLIDELNEENVDGIILDLRDNGGGSLQEATMLTDLFIDPGPVVQIRTSREEIDRRYTSRRVAYYRGPLLVLINRLSASASEIFAGAIQDYKRGLVVGNQTFGKGTVQSLSPLLQGQLKITESKFYRVSGDSTQHRGVIPDVKYFDFIKTEDIGESSYDTALPWDQIHKVPHATYFDFDDMVPFLQTKHNQRVVKDPDYVYLIDQANLIRENEDRKSISLNLEARKNEQTSIQSKSLAIENKRRKAKGLSTYKTVEELEAEDSNGDDDAPLSADQEIDPDKDPVLNETGHILVDYIKLLENDRVQKIANF